MSELPSQLLTTGDVARLAGVSPNAVFHWRRTGKLAPSETTAGGVSLYRRVDVEAYLATRPKRKATA